MYYFETQRFAKWNPATSSEPPSTKGDWIVNSNGAVCPVRCIKKVAEEHRTLPLSELQEIYGE